MILVFFIVLNIIVLSLFIMKKKRLHILEILVYWLIATYLYQNFSALCYMNFKTLIIPEKLTFELSHFVNRIILFPLLMVTFLHYYLVFNTTFKRILLTGSFIILLSGLEWLSDYVGVLIHVNWQIWWSPSFWLAALMVLIGVMTLFRKMLQKGGANA